MRGTPVSPPSHMLSCLVLALSLATTAAHAQNAPETPQPSPKAKVEQRIGVTDFAVEYSSPGVKGRKIWGELVPLDQVWRTGANASTKLTAKREFSIAGTKVPAGTYSVFTIPGASSWTFILNSKADASEGDYDQKLDVARATIKPETLGSSRERLTFLFADTTDTGANLDLEWEKMRLRVPLSVDTKAHVQASIDASLGEAWRPHFLAARYLHDSGGDLNQALNHINTSIAVKNHWWNNWVKAQILSKQGKKSEATAAAKQSQTLGKGDEIYEGFFKDPIAKAIDGWK